MALCIGKSDDGLQCPNDPLPNDTRCNRCKILYANHNETGRKSAFKLTRWQNRMLELGNDANVKSLHDEIGIIRLTLEGVVNSCQSDSDLIVHSHRISDLVSRSEKLITSLHKIEKSTGNLLDKSALLQLAGKIIGILKDEITDAMTIERIANKIVDVISEADYSEALENGYN